MYTLGRVFCKATVLTYLTKMLASYKDQAANLSCKSKDHSFQIGTIGRKWVTTLNLATGGKYCV